MIRGNLPGSLGTLYKRNAVRLKFPILIMANFRLTADLLRGISVTEASRTGVNTIVISQDICSLFSYKSVLQLHSRLINGRQILQCILGKR